MKRTALIEYRNVRSNGLRAYNCADGDQLLTVKMVQDESSLLINTTQGKSIHFKGSDVRRVGRVARGVRGIRLQDGDSVASMVEVTEESSEQRLLTITENGYGKRTALSEYRLQNRGGVGIIDINTGARNGGIVGSLLVDEDKIMLISRMESLSRSQFQHSIKVETPKV